MRSPAAFFSGFFRLWRILPAVKTTRNRQRPWGRGVLSELWYALGTWKYWRSSDFTRTSVKPKELLSEENPHQRIRRVSDWLLRRCFQVPRAFKRVSLSPAPTVAACSVRFLKTGNLPVIIQTESMSFSLGASKCARILIFWKWGEKDLYAKKHKCLNHIKNRGAFISAHHKKTVSFRQKERYNKGSEDYIKR